MVFLSLGSAILCIHICSRHILKYLYHQLNQAIWTCINIKCSPFTLPRKFPIIFILLCCITILGSQIIKTVKTLSVNWWRSVYSHSIIDLLRFSPPSFFCKRNAYPQDKVAKKIRLGVKVHRIPLTTINLLQPFYGAVNKMDIPKTTYDHIIDYPKTIMKI